MRIYEPGWPRSKVEAERTRDIIDRVRPYTMVLDAALEMTLRAVAHVHKKGVSGDFVECGVWQGGCAAAMRLADRVGGDELRALQLFDSFEGLPDAKSVEGPLAAVWQADTSNPGYYDNCRATVDQVRENLAALGVLDDSVALHVGWFESTAPAFARRDAARAIASCGWTATGTSRQRCAWSRCTPSCPRAVSC